MGLREISFIKWELPQNACSQSNSMQKEINNVGIVSETTGARYKGRSEPMRTLTFVAEQLIHTVKDCRHSTSEGSCGAAQFMVKSGLFLI